MLIDARARLAPNPVEDVVARASRVILGKERQIRLAMACILARGHLLIEDVPGVGKTTLSQALARLLGLEHRRIQFTSDLLPADVIGVSIFDRDNSTFRFHPGPCERQRCDELSKGMQQKVQFLAAILHAPDLLILDEPFSGLDPVNMRLLRDLVREQHERGATVLFSTHVMTQAEQLCEHIVMIHDGAKVLDDNLEAIRNAHAVRSLWYEPLDPQADVEILGTLGSLAGVAREGGSWALALAPGVRPEAAMHEVLATLPAARIELRRPTLEDVFLKMTGREIRDDEASSHDKLKGRLKRMGRVWR